MLFDLGYEVTDQEAAGAFRKVIPELPRNRFGVSPEDPTVIALRAWSPERQIPIIRDDIDLVFQDLLIRAIIQETTQGDLK